VIGIRHVFPFFVEEHGNICYLLSSLPRGPPTDTVRSCWLLMNRPASIEASRGLIFWVALGLPGCTPRAVISGDPLRGAACVEIGSQKNPPITKNRKKTTSAGSACVGLQEEGYGLQMVLPTVVQILS
jgi:hypothetical protein